MASSPNCSAHYHYITPDPDISGPGVLVSFILTALIALVVSMVGLVLPLLPETDNVNVGIPRRLEGFAHGLDP